MRASRFLQQLALACAVISLAALAAHGAVVEYDWTVDYSTQAPDCVPRLTIAINGQYPGPEIRVTAGDTVVVKLKNLIPTEDVVIHWHGILQRGTPWADGAAFISQCPIGPGETYTYEFVADRAGTYFYHGHIGMQRSAGLYGSLIVEPGPNTVEPFTYDGELNILLNDWWHKSMYEQELGLFSDPFVFVGEPQSLLIEGRGAYNCSSLPAANATSVSAGNSLSCNATNPRCAPFVLAVEPGRTYRLRVTSVASLSSLNFILEGHNMTVVEANGHYVEPVELQNLDIYSGETFSVLFTANQDPSRNYWAAINVRGRKPNTPTGLAILNYLPNPNTTRPTTPAPQSPIWNDTELSLANAKKYFAKAGYVQPLPNKPTDRYIFLLGTQNRLGKLYKWAANNISYVPTPSPVLASLKFNVTDELVPTPPDHYAAGYDIYVPPPSNQTTTGSGVYTFQFGDVVDVILQNANTLTVNNSEIHPWHLHGHDFWVLGFGEGVFDPSKDYAKLNYYNPPLMNTAPVFNHGWTVLRFVADNPGAWAFHCHVEAHFHMGMGVVFAEGIDLIPEIPKQNLGCGFTKNFLPGAVV